MRRFWHISVAETYFTFIFIYFFCMCFSIGVLAQNNSSQEVRRLQRTIFIFNLAQQMEWANPEAFSTFKIGVLGPDRIILDLQRMSQKRKINGKPVEITRFQFVKNIKNVQMLYVNHKYNYDVQYILNKISGKNILLVTEDYNFNTSMINMVNVGDSFEYEINARRIENEGFAIAPSLRQYAITSSEKWKQLYRKTEKSLTEVQEENKEKETVIKDKEEEIKSQKYRITNQRETIENQEKEIYSKEEEISDRNRKIENLYTQTKIQQKKYDEKLAIEKELEQNIQKQIEYIKAQEEQIEIRKEQIQIQADFLQEQESQIKEQKSVLDRQESEINAQKKINILLISIVAIILFTSLVVYRNYLIKKKLNDVLQKKNKEIYLQSLELESKNKELEQFAYIASHDLQEPLNTITSFINLITEDYGDNFDDIGKESLTFIQNASVRMKKLIDALLRYSRLGRSREFTEVNCNTVLNELKADLKIRIEDSGAKIITKNLPIVTGSEIEIRLLFQNLISNGIKFRAAGVTPKISISSIKKTNTKESKDFWEFSVKDNGIGIPDQHKERIFSIFQRLHSREDYEGTGIGLAHCKKIVESHGGEIWLESTVGKGSTFYFTIPS